MKDKNGVLRSLLLVTQFGVSMIVPVLLCTWLGAWLGRKLGLPILAVPLFLAGALAGARNVYVLAKKVYEDKEGDHAKKDQ